MKAIRISLPSTSPAIESQHGARLLGPRRARAVAREFLRRECDELGVALGESLARDANIVLEPGAHAVGASGQRPVHHLGLVAADSGRHPGRARQLAPELAE